ncbi:MAG: SDR family oxidoreductase [Candidatus Aureabacteria bacterium]|nr:SDR family oxidoreductase [Candidatus Auribacterota bacterium]
MARVLITGASGFLGWNLASMLRERHEVWGTWHRHAVAIQGVRLELLDLLDAGAVESFVARCAPGVIIHAAAMIDVDLCERDRAAARAVNAGAARNMATFAARGGARFIYCSTDMVFDGERGMYTETDEPRPINFYGMTKLEGERAAAALPDAVVARLSLMYGEGPPGHGSFFGAMRRSLAAGVPVRLFTDQYRTPLYVGDACRAFMRLVETPALCGLFHFGGAERVNRYEFGVRMAERCGYPRELLTPVRMSEMAELLARPADTSLDSRKAVRDLGVTFHDARGGIEAALGTRGH